MELRNNSDPWTGTWLSPNGVEHAVQNGYCVTCGGLHQRDEQDRRFSKGAQRISAEME